MAKDEPVFFCEDCGWPVNEEDENMCQNCALKAGNSEVARLRAATAESRRSYPEGTPEKYPGAKVRGFTILDAEQLLAHVENITTENAEWDAIANAMLDALLLIQTNEHGDSYSAGVAMSCIASLYERRKAYGHRGRVPRFLPTWLGGEADRVSGASASLRLRGERHGAYVAIAATVPSNTFFASCPTCGCEEFPTRATREEAEADARLHRESHQRGECDGVRPSGIPDHYTDAGIE